MGQRRDGLIIHCMLCRSLVGEVERVQERGHIWGRRQGLRMRGPPIPECLQGIKGLVVNMQRQRLSPCRPGDSPLGVCYQVRCLVQVGQDTGEEGVAQLLRTGPWADTGIDVEGGQARGMGTGDLKLRGDQVGDDSFRP